jgi:hypothetical protein
VIATIKPPGLRARLLRRARSQTPRAGNLIQLNANAAKRAEYQSIDARRRSPHHSAISPFSPKTAPPSLVVKTALRGIFMDARKIPNRLRSLQRLPIGSRSLPTIHGQLRSQPGQVAFDPQNQ